MAETKSRAGGAAATEGTSPTRGRWGLVAAALLLQFSIGAVYAWSVFSKALEGAGAFHLTKVQAALPFEVTIGMIFVGTFIGGRIQDRNGPRMVGLARGGVYPVRGLLPPFAPPPSPPWAVPVWSG